MQIHGSERVNVRKILWNSIWEARGYTSFWSGRMVESCFFLRISLYSTYIRPLRWMFISDTILYANTFRMQSIEYVENSTYFVNRTILSYISHSIGFSLHIPIVYKHMVFNMVSITFLRSLASGIAYKYVLYIQYYGNRCIIYIYTFKWLSKLVTSNRYYNWSSFPLMWASCIPFIL